MSEDIDNKTAAEGAWGTVEWGVDARGCRPAKEFYDRLEKGDRAKLLTLFQALADRGAISNREKFKMLGGKAGSPARDLFEFKSFQLRFIGAFVGKGTFVIVHALRKKQDDLPRADIERAVRLIAEHRRSEKQTKK